jgi:hypothetical protein
VESVAVEGKAVQADWCVFITWNIRGHLPREGDRYHAFVTTAVWAPWINGFGAEHAGRNWTVKQISNGALIFFV